MDSQLALIGYDDPETLHLANQLGARFIQAPSSGGDQDWTDWRAGLLADTGATQLVVALFHDVCPSLALAEMNLESWYHRAEKPLMHWMVALGGAALLCRDGGSIVAVTDNPTPLDASGFAAEGGGSAKPWRPWSVRWHFQKASAAFAPTAFSHPAA